MTLFSMDARVKPAHDESKVHSAAPLALFGRVRGRSSIWLQRLTSLKKLAYCRVLVAYPIGKCYDSFETETERVSQEAQLEVTER
jgi:hypothetical protein